MRDGHEREPLSTMVNAPRVSSSGLDVVFVDLNASADLLDRQETTAPRLAPSDIVRVERLADDPDRQRLWRTARIATRIVLEAVAGARLRRVDFIVEAGGRPGLGEGMPHFSVSHSGNAALIAVSRQAPIGVDIERLRPLSMNADRRNRIIAAATGSASDARFDPDRDTDIQRAWVRLEAIAKVRGTGIGVLLTEKAVIGGDRPRVHDNAHSPLDIVELDVPEPYVAAIAAANLPQEIAVRTFPSSADDLAAFLSRQ
ncbi:MAG TPA: phosphopantetheinyl transferase [Hyphomicrobium sp.]|nr:phosphopantetheinyl transferase [Hyphomicrobium sp.]